MPPPQGIALFPGVEWLNEATYSMTHGISPGVAMLTMLPQPGFTAAGGTLRFKYDTTVIDVLKCKVDQHSFQRTASGLIWRVSIFDRRWKWVAAGGRISGYYNLRNADGTIRDGTEQTPQKLAKLLLEAMGESGYDVGDLVNEQRPEVRWEAAPPPQELARLCDMLGCRVVLQLDNTVKLCKLGEGALLPSGAGIMEDSLTIDPPERPDKLEIACGPTRFQVDLELEAVGRENDDDGAIKLIADLGYAPSGGWSTQFPPHFDGVTGSFTRADGKVVANKKVAEETVFRMYRVKFPLNVKGHSEEIADLDHIVIELDQVDTKTEGGLKVNKPAEVWGTWYSDEDDLGNETDTVVDVPWSWDAKLGIITFREPVYRNSTAATLSPTTATLYLKTAVQVRHKDHLALLGAYRSEVLGNWGTQARVVHHEELQLAYKDGKRVNEAEIYKATDYYLDGLKRQYQTPLPQTRTYIGLRATDLDGAIHQVTWSVTSRGTTTTISRNTEQTDRTIPYKEKRILEKMQQVDQENERYKHSRPQRSPEGP